MLFEESAGFVSELRSPAQWLLHTAAITALLGVSFMLCKFAFAAPTGPGVTSRLPLPPGPKDKWFNPGPRTPLRYAEMTEIYGPVFSFRQGSKVFVVIGRYQAAVDIMQKHGADLADRPRMIAAGDIVSGGMRTLLTPAGDRLKRLRRALHSQLQPSVVPQWLPLQTRNIKVLVLDILREPDKHIEHAQRFAASLVMTMTYGKTSPTYYSDPEVQEINRNGSRLGTLTQGARAHIVDIYPILRYIPWFTKTLRQWHEDELGLFTRQLNQAQEQMKLNIAQPSFVTYLLERREQYGLSNDEMAFLAGSMFGAGSATTASAISFVIMAAAVYPEEQAKVQAELDTVIGHDRVPTAEDKASLPRVVAFYLESFRWRPTSWGSFAHRATQDIFWNNYVIPAGATVIGNHWAIGLDPEVYTEPTAFKPDRWLDAGGRIRGDMTFFNYGFGRRACPGQHLANNSVFLATALILWAFKISEDPSHPIDAMKFSDGQSIRPDPFTVNFEPRLDSVEELVTASLS